MRRGALPFDISGFFDNINHDSLFGVSKFRSLVIDRRIHLRFNVLMADTLSIWWALANLAQSISHVPFFYIFVVAGTWSQIPRVTRMIVGIPSTSSSESGSILSPTKPGLSLLPSHLFPKLSLFRLLRHWPLMRSTCQSDAEPELLITPYKFSATLVEYNVSRPMVLPSGHPRLLMFKLALSGLSFDFPSNGLRHRWISPMLIRNARLIYECGNLVFLCHSFRFPPARG